MSFKTRNEKRAYRSGIFKGLFQRRRKKNRTRRVRSVRVYRNRNESKKRASRHKIVKRRIGSAVQRKKPPYDDFDYDSRGRIKGSWIDGRFEPD